MAVLKRITRKKLYPHKITICCCDFCNKRYELYGHRKRYDDSKTTFCCHDCHKAFQREEASKFKKIEEIVDVLSGQFTFSFNDISWQKNIIYVLQNKINKKCYVGKSTTPLQQRWNRHIKDAESKRNGSIIGRAIRKYGADNFDVYCLEVVGNVELLAEREIYWIDKLNTQKNGYNITLGGGGMLGHKHSKKTKEKIAKAHRGKIVSKETREKQSRARKGKCYRKNYKHSPETKKKMSIAARKRNYTSKAYKESRKRAVEKCKKPVVQMDLEGNVIKVWSCAKEVEQVLGIFATQIASVCKGKNNKAGNFKWKYLIEKEI